MQQESRVDSWLLSEVKRGVSLSISIYSKFLEAASLLKGFKADLYL